MAEAADLLRDGGDLHRERQASSVQAGQQTVDPGYWVQHLRATVLFAKGLETLTGEAPCVLLEVGPGRTLCGLVKASQRQQVAVASLPQRSASISA